MSEPTAPPPYQQTGPYPTGASPQEPPPKYEPPKGHQGYPPQSGYPPQAGYPPQGYQTGPVGAVYTQPQPVTVIQLSYGPSPVTVNCPHCHNHVTTSLVYETGALTWIVSGLLCLFGPLLGLIGPACLMGNVAQFDAVQDTCPDHLTCMYRCWLGCCLIPFCVSDLQDVIHKCPNCSQTCGVFRRLS